MFAAILLGVAAVLNVIYGIAAIADSKFFIADQKYIISNLNTWGWVMLVLGVAQGFAMYSLFSGGLYGRIFAICTATLSAIGALLSIPAYPLWSLAIFALSIVIIHQVATRGAEGREEPLTMEGREERLT
jgi:hypothetical protein